MNLHTLKPAKGAVKKAKRIGRGQGSGKGGTSTRGHKGAKSRSGYSQKRGFEGGQMPLQRRLPRFGFSNFAHRVEYKVINLFTIQELAEKANVTVINPEILVHNGLASKKDLIKILADGEIKASLNITAHAFSAKAKESIEKAGGTANVLAQ
ncbi:MAG: 50S ribosomal protein L15 [Cytophagales bacterium]|nr:MAG: 50S ribosomal protein L15 [Cytophagales bacterium]